LSTSPDFAKYCSEFIDKAVPVVLEAEKRVHLTQKLKAIYNADGSMSSKYVPDYVRFILTIQEEFKNLREFQDLLELIQKNTKFSGTRADFENIVILVLGRFLEIISSEKGVIRDNLNSNDFTALDDIIRLCKITIQEI